MESLVFLRAAVTLFYTTTVLTLTSSQQTAHYFLYQTSEYPRDCTDVQRRCSTVNTSGVYIIKPDGFEEPFEVFCDNDVNTGGWTVIQRRENDNVNFNRTWSQYKQGFGFLSTDFWLGNEKLAYLTNQAVYNLLIEVELLDGSIFNISYNEFRISDEFGKYSLQPVGPFESSENQVFTPCPANEYFNEDCTQRCFCDSSGLECAAVSCHRNAACIEVHDGVRNCSCNEGHIGDGIICTAPTTVPPVYRDCKEIFDAGTTESGEYAILPDGWTDGPFDVFCEMGDGGGWTVFQRRKDDTTNFYRDWNSYKQGFGDISESFWLGNEKLHHLTNQKDYQLRLDIITSDGTPLDAEWAEFEIESESNKYRMNKLGSRSTNSGGYAGRYLSYSRGKQFSTHDQDNDACGNFNCAALHRSGWWHYAHYCWNCWSDSHANHIQYSSSCTSSCTDDNLNGVHNGGNGEKTYSGNTYYCNGNCDCSYFYCDPQFVEMKIRPSS